MSTSKGTERVNEEGATEIKVGTVDYRSPPGADDQPPKKENVEVTHLPRTDDEPGTGRGVTAEAASKVAGKILSAKEKLGASTNSGDKNN